MQYEWGNRAEAKKNFNMIIDVFRETPYPDAELTWYTAKACVILKRFEDANDLFYDAHDLDKQDWRILVDWANLFLAKFNFADARSTFSDALKTNPACTPAKIGLARANMDENAMISFQIMEDLLETNPDDKNVLALATRFHALSNKTEKAQEYINLALKDYPDDLSLLTISALISLKKTDEGNFNKIENKVLNINPGYADFYTEAGDFLARTYLFKEAVENYQKALVLDPENTKARAGLGTALSRLAKLEAAKKELELAFRDDPYNIWTGNLLKLFDSYVDYDTVQTEHFLIRMHKDDKPIIGVYAAELAENAWNEYQSRYNFNFDFRITIEIFPKHDDFAVRCFGLPGSQVFLGICFGPLVTMNSPKARPVGSFNWQETLWHELAHVIHLTLTDNRIPRWLAEGVAVWEAARAKSSWSMNMELAMIRALNDDAVIPLAELNAGFTSNPERVTFSYYQSSLMVDYIYVKHGMKALLALFEEYKNDHTTADALDAVIGMDEDEFDQGFHEWLKTEFNYADVSFTFSDGNENPHNQSQDIDYEKRLTDDENDFYALLKVGRARLEKDDESGVELLEKAIKLFPEYTRHGNAYTLLGNYFFKKENYKKAGEYFKKLTSRNGESFAANKKLVTIAKETNDDELLAFACNNLVEIYPYDIDIHKTWGQVLLKNGKYKNAVREFEIELALQPGDLADTHYRLARGYLGLGKKSKAKRHALQALEIAPTFQPAQQILIRSKAN
ncbi:MAG: tetratricopeptide repeat protein [Calditrichaeota bacterium]|nr:MAG: tetratricopeptide repeat protein [Calditrichota bacterium]